MTVHGGFSGLSILDGEYITTEVGWAVGDVGETDKKKIRVLIRLNVKMWEKQVRKKIRVLVKLNVRVNVRL